MLHASDARLIDQLAPEILREELAAQRGPLADPAGIVLEHGLPEALLLRVLRHGPRPLMRCLLEGARSPSQEVDGALQLRDALGFHLHVVGLERCPGKEALGRECQSGAAAGIELRAIPRLPPFCQYAKALCEDAVDVLQSLERSEDLPCDQERRDRALLRPDIQHLLDVVEDAPHVHEGKGVPVAGVVVQRLPHTGEHA
mmetsp:Transcript_95121/g.273883  ORF Transcript_95121/g.273883 Transcript_95121/m.273883 type:complete len:200 (-) Transcript_95121:207-806(-)